MTLIKLKIEFLLSVDSFSYKGFPQHLIAQMRVAPATSR